MVRWSSQYHDSDGLRKWFLILGRKYQGTTPGNCKVVGSHLQSELIFRIHNYEFSHRNNRLGSSSPSRLSKKPLIPRQSESALKSPAGNAREQRSHRILAHGDESSNHGRKVLDDTATQRPASCCSLTSLAAHTLTACWELMKSGTLTRNCFSSCINIHSTCQIPNERAWHLLSQ